MGKWAWTERKFSFDYPAAKWPDLMERVRGTPARIEEILAGKAVLVAADMTNRKTHEADHNAKDIRALCAELRVERAKLVARFDALHEADWGKSALHPRLQQPMRIVDIAYFTAEHDDYPIARMGELIRLIS